MKASIAIVVILGTSLGLIFAVSGRGDEGYLESGRAALAAGDLTGAVAKLRIAIDRGATDPTARIDLATALERLGREIEALRTLLPVALGPEDPTIAHDEVLRRVVALGPDDATVLALGPIIQRRATRADATTGDHLALAEFERLRFARARELLDEETLAARRRGAPPRLERLARNDTTLRGLERTELFQLFELHGDTGARARVEALLRLIEESGSRALDAWDLAARDARESPATRVAHAEAQLDRGLHEALEATLAPLLADPTAERHLDAAVLLGRSLAARGDHQAILARLVPLATSSPEAETALWQFVARAHYALREPRPLLALSRRRADLEPEAAWPRFFIGSALLLLERPEDALPHLRAAEALVRGEPVFLHVLATALALTERHEQAVGLFELAALRRPDDERMRIEGARLLAAAGLDGEAEELLAGADASNPLADPLAKLPPHVQAALAELQLRRVPPMTDRLSAESARAEAPDNPWPLLEAARFALIEGDDDAARRLCDDAIDRFAWLDEAWILAGHAELAGNRLEAARQRTEQVLSRAPENAAARRLLVEIERRDDRHDEALRALALLPADDPWTLRMRASLLLRAERGPEAAVALRALHESGLLTEAEWPVYVRTEIAHGDRNRPLQRWLAERSTRPLTAAEQLEAARLERLAGRDEAARDRLRALLRDTTQGGDERLAAAEALASADEIRPDDLNVLTTISRGADDARSREVRARALELGFGSLDTPLTWPRWRRLLQLRRLSPPTADRLATRLLLGPLDQPVVGWRIARTIPLETLKTEELAAITRGAIRGGTAADLDDLARRLEPLGTRAAPLVAELALRSAVRFGDSGGITRLRREASPLLGEERVAVIEVEEAFRLGQDDRVRALSIGDRWNRGTVREIAEYAAEAALRSGTADDLRAFVAVAERRWAESAILDRAADVLLVIDGDLAVARTRLEARPLTTDIDRALRTVVDGLTRKRSTPGSLADYAAALPGDQSTARRDRLGALLRVPNCVRGDLVRVHRALGGRETSIARWQRALCMAEFGMTVPVARRSALRMISALRDEAGLASDPISNVLSWVQIGAGQGARALETLKKHLAEPSPPPTIVTLAALAIIYSGEAGNLTSLINGTLGTGPITGRVVEDLAQALLERDQPEIALDFLQRVSLAGREVVNLRIRAHLALDQEAAAIREVAQLDPEPNESFDRLILRARAQPNAEARARALRGLADSPMAGPLDRMSALAHLGAGAEAGREARALLEREPPGLDTLATVARLLAPLARAPREASDALDLLTWLAPDRLGR